MATRVILTDTVGAWEGRGLVFVGPTQVMIGRSETCSLRLHDPTVSRRHCLIDVGTDGAWVRDLESRNGTVINAEQVRPPAVGDEGALRRLYDGDELRVGCHAFHVGVEILGVPVRRYVDGEVLYGAGI
jgi:pSer/pThr/pTyr-binding forkhead associated (FHA) protein